MRAVEVDPRHKRGAAHYAAKPMLLNRATAEGIRDGSVTAVFRRWEVPRARVGGTQRTVAGVIRFTSVEPVVGELTDEDARSAGLPSVQALRKADRGKPGRPVVPDRGRLRSPGRAGVAAGASPVRRRRHRHR